MNIRNEKGSITLESVVSFTAFLFLMVTIISLLNFCRAQAIMSKMVNEIAKEMSQYSYLYSVSGIQNLDKTVTKTAAEKKKDLDAVANNFNDITSQISSMIVSKQDKDAVDTPEEISLISTAQIDKYIESGNALDTKSRAMLESFKSIGSNPAGYMKAIGYVLAEAVSDQVKSVLAENLSKAMSRKYLGASDEEIDSVLAGLNIVDGFDGLDFRYSQMFHSQKPDDIIITVVYDVELIQLLDLDLKATFVQTAHARAWLNGDMDPESRKPKSEVEEEEEKRNLEDPEWSIWEMAAVSRGKYIVKAEKRKVLLGNAEEAFTSGVDAYNPDTNELITVRSIDTYANSYKDPSDLEKKINSLVNKHIDDTKNLESITTRETITETLSQNKKHDLTDRDKKYKLILIVPNESDMEVLTNIKKTIEKQYGDDVTLDIKEGYGMSTNMTSDEG